MNVHIHKMFTTNERMECLNDTCYLLRALLGTNNVLIENIVYDLDYIYIC